MRIYIASIPVDDVAKARDFYTEVLGFVVKDDVEQGEFRWLTVTNAEGGSDVELLLEPKGHPAAGPWTKALKDDGIPITQFSTTDIEREFAELKAKSVNFSMEPTEVGPATIAIFDDTVGNLIQLVQFNDSATKPHESQV